MLILIYAISVSVFCFSFLYSRVLMDTLQVLTISKLSITIINSTSHSDNEKEKLIQKNAISLVKKSIVISIKISLILFSSIMPVLLIELIKAGILEQLIDFSLRLDVMIYTIIVLTILTIIIKKFVNK